MTLMQFMQDTRKEFPDFEIRYKAASNFMRFIAKLLLIVTFGTQKTFMTGYTTTINRTIYVPLGWSSWTDDQKVSILRHERVHMRQARKHGFLLFALLYVLVPFPFVFAYCRARFEWEAYTESMRVIVERAGLQVLDDPKYKQHIFKHFTTGAYGWMWPFEDTLEKWYAASRKQIEAELRG